ncbi:MULTISPECIES: NACHT domain-containing protein [unclassified Xanthomonas]|uniref:NACHT domain-containing protein n=1 Tax=unclassified Xanthomonas TaxID=2643310 RepID=UPI002B23BE45|nr:MULTISPECIES: NACHT domain-containing protein [unclassified Xanthomonas]MEA9562719.1 NACHT domain-containing protein [Xanthomonas sp. WHRI 8932A]MEA9633772.1 NACHT domain-containing protein [Xanthomonas sp. WHRI 8812E]
MEELATIDALTPVLSQFRPKNSSSRLDIRESLALIDFHTRLVYTLAVCLGKRPEGMPIRMSPVPGFGTMLAPLRKGESYAAEASTWISSMVGNWGNEITVAFEKFKVPRYSSLKSLRDRLSHGQPLPSDSEVIELISAELSRLLDQLDVILKRNLLDTYVTAREDRLIIQKRKEKSLFEVSPLWMWSEAFNAIQVYSHLSGDGIHYIAPDGDIFSESSDPIVTRFRKTFIGDGFAQQGGLGRLVKDVLADVGAYTEDYSRPSYFFGDGEHAGILFVPWTRSTSESNVPRLDAFRIGIADQREWRVKGGEWVSYIAFLKHISNWDFLARRLAIGLETYANEREQEEISRLGFPKSTGVRGPTLIRERKDFGVSDNEKEFDLVARIDDSCQNVKPSTSAFFLIGQAGLGKTELMVNAAIERARAIEKKPSSPLPLYLFISSSGRTLSSLEDAVNSALTITKVLSSHSAKALCRNGLLVLLVDGFDELLGSSGYENALGSLEPWFNELRGRGVLVASARSSYYLTQYRKSLALATHLNVDHTLLELQAWTKADSKKYLTAMGADESVLRSVKEREWPVLSVPFFAKAFAAWLELQSDSAQAIPSVYEIVIEQYLEREALKLRDPNAGELLSSDELRELFSDIAEIMQSTTSREIEQSDLVACAEAVVGTDALDRARPGLTRRLSSLCGLGVAFDASGHSQFGFSHEVLFDCFLSLALQRKLTGVVSTASILRLFSASKINPVAFEWLVEKMPAASKILAQSVEFMVPAGNEGTVLASNLGALWEEMLGANQGVPPTLRAIGLQLEKIQLAKSGWSSLDISRSNVGELSIPPGLTAVVNVTNSTIEFLNAKSPDLLSRALTGVESSDIRSLYVGDRFADNLTDIRAALEDLGLVSRSKVLQNDASREQASNFIGRLTRRSEMPVVLDRDDYSAEDQRLSWIGHADQGEWVKFVDALEHSGMARLEAMPASGPAKVRLAYNKPLTALFDTPLSSEATQFWARYGGGG